MNGEGEDPLVSQNGHSRGVSESSVYSEASSTGSVGRVKKRKSSSGSKKRKKSKDVIEIEQSVEGLETKEKKNGRHSVLIDEVELFQQLDINQENPKVPHQKLTLKEIKRSSKRSQSPMNSDVSLLDGNGNVQSFAPEKRRYTRARSDNDLLPPPTIVTEIIEQENKIEKGEIKNIVNEESKTIEIQTLKKKEKSSTVREKKKRESIRIQDTFQNGDKEKDREKRKSKRVSKTIDPNSQDVLTKEEKRALKSTRSTLVRDESTNESVIPSSSVDSSLTMTNSESSINQSKSSIDSLNRTIEESFVFKGNMLTKVKQTDSKSSENSSSLLRNAHGETPEIYLQRVTDDEDLEDLGQVFGKKFFFFFFFFVLEMNFQLQF